MTTTSDNYHSAYSLWAPRYEVSDAFHTIDTDPGFSLWFDDVTVAPA